MSISDEDSKILKRVQKGIKAGKYDGVVAALEEGEGFVVTIEKTQVQLIKKDGKLVAKLDDDIDEKPIIRI